jgi:hypothetical protein
VLCLVPPDKYAALNGPVAATAADLAALGYVPAEPTQATGEVTVTRAHREAALTAYAGSHDNALPHELSWMMGDEHRESNDTRRLNAIAAALAAAEQTGFAAGRASGGGRKATTVSDTEILIALFSLRAALHRGSESGEYFFSVFGKPASPKSFKTILEAARHACDALGMLPPPPEKPTEGGGR